jgi:acetyl-CoA carboxylase biotin carboxyl carrier protein
VTLTAQDVAEITRLLEESEFDELHVEQDGLKLTLKRGAAARRDGGQTASAPVASPALASAAGPAGAGAEPRGEHPPSATDRAVLNVTAPLVGIFYRAPRPGAPPYIEVGSPVQEDTVIGIIEVMKLMNAVRAEARGTVLEVLVEDGAVVEYGQVLLRISPGAPGG